MIWGGVVNHLGASPFLLFLASSLCMHSGRESSIIFVLRMTVSFQSNAFVLNIEYCSCYCLMFITIDTTTCKSVEVKFKMNLQNVSLFR